MFNRLRRRPSPAAAIAGAALFVALSGTAVAQTDILITSPDQLGPNVVTSPAIAPNSVSGADVFAETLTDSDLRDPQLKVRALGSGSVLSGSDGTVTRVAEGRYDVTFNTSSLNANGGGNVDTMLNNNCAFTATSRNQLAMMSVSGPLAATPNTVRVSANFPENVSGGVLMGSVDSQFDVLASC